VEGYPHELPQDSTLAQAARALEDGRLAGEVLDSDWRLRYVSSELRNLIGEHRDERLGYGTLSTVRASTYPDIWRLDEESRKTWWRLDGPFLRHDFRGREDAILDELTAAIPAEQFLGRSPEEPPIAWAGKFSTTFADGPPANVGRLVVRLLRTDGSLAGTMGLYVGGGLRGSVQAMLSRGDDGMFERMAALLEPARRPAAILFCDLEASSVHSRKLSSKAYFGLIRELTTTIDEAVIAHGGIVGKHVGDGVTAFFLAEQVGGEAQAAEAALRSALQVAREVASIDAGGSPPRVNAGLHWGGTLVIGQVVTGGRLEVTALGDEVNQAARVQETAHGGRILATKDLLERIEPASAAELGIDPDTALYALLAELEDVTDKAVRDAGGLAVAEVGALREVR
jgi:class 3 adenylate cyclase